MTRSYSYIGPPDILRRVQREPVGAPIFNRADLQAWMDTQPSTQTSLPATFIVDLNGTLLLADRHSEHVVCAGGRAVLAAGELVIERGQPLQVSSVTNQSTGYCPQPDCWDAIHLALRRLDLSVPDGFTPPFVFRRCEYCGQTNVVKDDDFECAICSHPLPVQWNF